MPRRAHAPTFDLQSHSTHSDGELSPTEVVARAAAAGVELLALTDHDSVDGVEEALAAAREHQIKLIRAAEISALDDQGEDLHILGYDIDHTSPALLDALAGFRNDRVDRATKLARALRELGFDLDTRALQARRDAGESIGRPHLAQAVVDHPANAQRLKAEGLQTEADVLEAYLIAGKPAFRPRALPTIPEAVALIHAAGGLAVWAHPFWDFGDDDLVLETIDRFAALRIDGIETFYVTHTTHQTELAYQRAKELNLFTTGSADFHGPGHPRFHTFRNFNLNGLDPDLGPLR